MRQRAYWTPQALLSRNARINYVVGAGGIGKTHGVKAQLFRDFFKHGKEAITLVRYEKDIGRLDKSRFFTEQIIRTALPAAFDFDFVVQRGKPVLEFSYNNKKTKKISQHKLKVVKNEIVLDDRPAMIFKSINVSRSLKGVEYPRVYNVFMDEVFLKNRDKHLYVPGEATSIKDLAYSTFRDRKNVRFFLLSNTTNINNPHFANLHFEKEARDGRFHWAKKNVLVEYPPHTTKEVSGTTWFLDWADGDEEISSRFNNSFHISGREKIKVQRARKFHRLNVMNKEGKTFSLSYIPETHDNDRLGISHMMYVAKNLDLSRPVYAADLDFVDDGCLPFPSRSSKMAQWILYKFTYGQTLYESVRVKYEFQDFISRL